MGITSARKSVIGAIKEDEPPPVSDLVVVVQKDVAVIRTLGVETLLPKSK